MTSHNLTTRYVANPDDPSLTDISYWLTIEQILKDDRATTADVAAVVDALYDIDPCVDSTVTGTEPPDEEAPTEEKLIEAATDTFDLEECNRRKSGTYLAELKIVRSHPALPYTLRLSVGKIKKTIIISANIAASVDVQSASSVTLEYPIQSGLVAAWLGTVYSAAGAITPPVIKASGNSLFWPGQVTGTIRVEYATTYDLVTVEVPGIPKYTGSPLGDPQDSSALAFYHFQVYQTNISPPPTDTGADALTLAEICGWGTGTQLDTPDDPEPEPEPPAMPVYGCIEESLMFGDPNYYAEKCCEAKTPNGCAVRKEVNPGGKTLDQETIDRLTLEHAGPIEFIGVGPDGVEGCGAIYTRQTVKPKNCCDEAEPLEWNDAESADVIARGTWVWVEVIGGIGPYFWSVRGQGFTLDGYSLRDGYTDLNYTRIYASLLACGICKITVTDSCTEVKANLRCTTGQWLSVGYSSPLCNVYNHPEQFPDLFLCSAYGGTLYSTVKNYYDGEYWVGRGRTPPEQYDIGFDRISYVCGIYATLSDPGIGGIRHLPIVFDSVFRPELLPNFTIMYPALYSDGVPHSCYPVDGGVVSAYLYWNEFQLTIYKWIC